MGVISMTPLLHLCLCLPLLHLHPLLRLQAPSVYLSSSGIGFTQLPMHLVFGRSIYIGLHMTQTPSSHPMTYITLIRPPPTAFLILMMSKMDTLGTVTNQLNCLWTGETMVKL